ncbi:MAG: hypothetical protein Q8P50_11570 [Bacillota bacterium]|nr:hypothetical protein [Bacillota bacterium]
MLLVAGRAMSAQYTPSQVGRYYFKAMYIQGEIASPDDAEPLDVVAQGQPLVTTKVTQSKTPDPPTVAVTSVSRATPAVYDFAKVTVDGQPASGYVRFWVKTPTAGTWGQVDTAPSTQWVSLRSDGTAWSILYTPALPTGSSSWTYYFRAQYKASLSDEGSLYSGETDEPLTVPGIWIDQHYPNVVLTATGTGTSGGGNIWGIQKSVSPAAITFQNYDSATLRRETSKTVTYTIAVTKTPGSGGVSAVDGSIQAQNTGDASTSGLRITAQLQYKDAGGNWQNVSGAFKEWKAPEITDLSPGTKTSVLTFSFTPSGGTEYRIKVDSFIDNAGSAEKNKYVTPTITAGGTSNNTASVIDVFKKSGNYPLIQVELEPSPGVVNPADALGKASEAQKKNTPYNFTFKLVPKSTNIIIEPLAPGVTSSSFKEQNQFRYILEVGMGNVFVIKPANAAQFSEGGTFQFDMIVTQNVPQFPLDVTFRLPNEAVLKETDTGREVAVVANLTILVRNLPTGGNAMMYLGFGALITTLGLFLRKRRY